MLTKTSIIENQLISEIRSGKLPVGSRIPSRSQLCSRFKCSRTVVEKALNIMTVNGFICGKKGSGTFVSDRYLHPREIKHIKIISDFNIHSGNISLLPILNFDDLGISVDWMPFNKAEADIDQLSQPGTAVISQRPHISQLFLLDKLQKRNIPVLLLNRNYDGFDHIITDPEASIREGISWLLIEAGRDIAFVSRRPSIKRPYTAERILAFYEAAIEFGAHLRGNWCLSKNFDDFTENIADTAHALFAAPKHPDGIFILDADLVLPVVNCSQGYGLTPGKDYKLLTFDNIPELENRPGIAMMQQPNLLYEKEIRRWLDSLQSNVRFKAALKTQLKVTN